jgi:hypothetical protein
MFNDRCESIKDVKRMEVINKLMNNPMPKYFISSVADIEKILLKK